MPTAAEHLEGGASMKFAIIALLLVTAGTVLGLLMAAGDD